MHSPISAIRSIVIILAALLSASGCRSHKNSGTPAPETPVHMTAEDLGAAMTAVNKEWEAVSLPASFTLMSPLEMSVSGKVTFRRGEYIHLSLRMLGMEVAYLYADRDSVYLVDKFHRNYVSESFSAVSSRYGVTLENLQDLLLGRPFEVGGPSLTPATAGHFRFSEQSGVRNTAVAAEQRDRSDISVLFFAEAGNGFTGMPDFVSVIPSEGTYLTCTYLSPEQTPCGVTPGQVDLTAGLPRLTSAAQARIIWKLKDARWNERASLVEFRRPSASYTRLSLTELIRSLSSR